MWFINDASVISGAGSSYSIIVFLWSVFSLLYSW